MKALQLMKKARSVKERADKYATRIATSIKVDVLNPLQEKVEKFDDEIFDLENFSLDTDLNRGKRMMTKEEVQERFEKIIDLKFRQQLVQLELTSKQASYDELFVDEEEVVTEA